MAWVKIPKEHFPVFEAALPLDDRIEVKNMFGGLAAMLNGQMMSGLFATSAMVKVSPADQNALAALGGKPFDPMGNGRVMADTFTLPQAEFDDAARLRGWLEKAHAYVSSLPAKKKKAPAARAVSAKPAVAKEKAAPKKVVAAKKKAAKKAG